MATKVLSSVNNRQKFLYQKQKFLTLPLCCLLCNSLIQPNYDCACSAWYPSLGLLTYVGFFSTKWSDTFRSFFAYGEEQESWTKNYNHVKNHLPKGV